MMAEQVKPDVFDPPHHKLTTNIQTELDALLKEYELQFAKDEKSIGTTPLTSMKIDTGNSYPVSQKPYSIAMKHCQWVKEEIEKLLAESVKELREEMRCYLSFLDKEVFEGVTPLVETSSNPAEEAKPHSMTTMPAIASKEQATRKTSQELAKERKSPKFPRWEKVLHPSQPVVVTGQLPHLSRSLEQTCLLMANCDQHMKIAPTEAPSPMQELEVAQ